MFSAVRINGTFHAPKNYIEWRRSGREIWNARHHLIKKSQEIAADKRALRQLLEAFRLECEIELDRKLNDSSTRREIGKLISRGFVKRQ